MKKVTCIIPAYNEEKRIENVLKVVYEHPLLDEIIVINDGSEDNTKEIIKRFRGIKLISYKHNKGKNYAIISGVIKSKNNIVLLLDSDLKGLNKNDIEDLIMPVIGNKADVTIGKIKNCLLIFKIFGIDIISGQRVFHKSLFGNYGDILNLPSYGLEVFLNEKIIKKNLRVKVIHLRNVHGIRKSEKIGIIKGIKEEANMILDMVKTIGILRMIFQLKRMASLNLK